MKILELNFERGWRGGERQTLLQMKHFRQAGYQIELLARADHPLAKVAAEETFQVHSYQRTSAGLHFLAKHAKQYDLLHAQTAHTLTWCVGLKWWHKRPIVYTRRVAFDLKNHLHAFKYRWVDHIVAISQAAAASLEQYGIKNVEVIFSAVQPIPVRPELLTAFKTHHGLFNKKIIATVAALTPEKDPFTLIDAIALLHSQGVHDFIFLHFGDGPLLKEAKQRVQEKNLSNVYRFMGFQAEVEQLFPLMDAFVMSSITEGLGSSVLDAFVARVPVAATAAGGLKEILSENRGLLSPVGNVQHLAQNINNLLDANPIAVATQLDRTERAYDWVMSQCSIERTGNQYLNIFEKLIRQN